MNIYVTTVMVVVSLIALAYWRWVRDYAIKSGLTLMSLVALLILTIIQIIVTKNPNVVAAWWLLIAIFVALAVSITISFLKWEKKTLFSEEDDERPVKKPKKEVVKK